MIADMPWGGSRALPAAVVVLSTLALGAPVAASPAPVPSPAASGGRTLLAHDAHGAAAVRALSDRLDTAAGVNQMSPHTLAATLRQDPTAWLDTHGRLYYVDPAPAATTSSAVPEQAAQP